MGYKISKVAYNQDGTWRVVESITQGSVSVNIEQQGLDAQFSEGSTEAQFSISTPDSGTTITNQNTGVSGTAFNTAYPGNYSFKIDADNQKVFIYNNSGEIVNRYLLNMPSDTSYTKYKREIYLVDISTGAKTKITGSCTGQFSTTVCILVRCYVSGRSYDISFSTTNTNSYWKDANGARVVSTIANYGETISTTSNTVKIGAATYTLVASAPEGQTVQSTSVRLDSSSSTTPTTVTCPITVVGVITSKVNLCTVSWTKTNCSVVAFTDASSEIASGNTVPYGTRVIFYITPNDGYKYNGSSERVVESCTATSNIVKTFIASATGTTLTIYKSINLSKVYYYQGGAWKESTSNVTIVSCSYGDTILVAGEPNAGYESEYTKSSPQSVSIDSTEGVEVSMEASIKLFIVSWSSTNCTIRYRQGQSTGELITNGSEVAYGTVIYVEATPTTGYTMVNYEPRFTVTERSSRSYTASINQITLTIDKATGIDKVYSDYQSSSGSTEVGRTLVVPYGTIVNFYATATTGYTSRYTQSSPNRVEAKGNAVVYMTSNAKDYIVKWTTTNCSATLTYGSSRKSMFQGISLPYGTVVYASCVANTGYTMNSYETSFTVTSDMNQSYVASAAVGKLYISKTSNVNAVYAKVGSATTWTQVTGDYIEAATGQMVYLYGEPKSGYTMDEYSSSSPYAEAKAATPERVMFSATAKEYPVKWTASNCSVTMTYGSSRKPLSNGGKVPYGTTVYVACTADTGFTMGSYETSFTVTDETNKSYSATINNYTLTIGKGSHISKVYCDYPSTKEYTAPISIPYKTTVHVWAEAETGYTPEYSSSNKREVIMEDDRSITLFSEANEYTVSWTNSNCTTTMTYGSSRKPLSNGGRVPYGTTVYVSCTAIDGYTMNSYDTSFVVTSAASKSYSATINSYAITLVAGNNVSTMYYKIDGYTAKTYTGPFKANYNSKVYAWSDADTGYAPDNTESDPKVINSVKDKATIYLYATAKEYPVNWTTSKCSATMTYGSSRKPLSNGGKVPYGTTVYVSCTANTGHTMTSYDTSFVVTKEENKFYAALANSYTVTLAKGNNVSTIYYKINNGDTQTYSSAFSATYESSLSMWCTASTGYIPNYGSSNPVTTTIRDNYSRTFYATPAEYAVSWSASNCNVSVTYGSSRKALSNGSKLPYGTVVYVSCSAYTGYTMNAYATSFTVTGTSNKSYSASINTYTYNITGFDSSHMSAVHYKVGSNSEQTAYGNTSFTVPYGTGVYVYADYKTGHDGRYNGYSNRWTSSCTGADTCPLYGWISSYGVSFGGSGGTWYNESSGSSLITSVPYGSTWSVSGNGSTQRVQLTINYSTGGSYVAYWIPDTWERYESYKDGSYTKYHNVTRRKMGYISPTSGSVGTSGQSFTGSSETW